MNGNEKTWLFLSRRRRFSLLFFASQIHKQQPIFHFLTRHNYLGLPFIFFFAQWIIFLPVFWLILWQSFLLCYFLTAGLGSCGPRTWLFLFIASGSTHCFSHPKFLNATNLYFLDTGGPLLTQFSLPRIPLPRFLAYVSASPTNTNFA